MATVIIKGYPNTKTTIKLPKVVRVVVKVEGPFDTVNNKLEYIEKEKEYIYVATLRNNNVNPKKINWAISYDKDDHCKSYKLFSGGELDGDTLKVKIKTEKPKEKFKIYAYAGGLPHKDVFVEVNILNLPMIIARSVKRAGVCYDTNGKNCTRQDIKNLGIDYPKEKTRLKTALEKGFDDIGKSVDVVDKDSRVNYAMDVIKEYSEYSNDKLFEILKYDLDDWALGVLDDNLHSMIDYFKKNIDTSSKYQDIRLTNAVSDHQRTKDFINGFSPLLKNAIKENTNSIFNLKVKNTKNQFLRKEYEKKSGGNPDVLGIKGLQELNSLKYPDKFGGLGVSIDGTQAYDISLTEFYFDNNSYKGKFRLEISDHFGLDSGDILKDYIRKNEEFICWYILQHLRGYKPFITYVPIIYSFNGNLTTNEIEINKD